MPQKENPTIQPESTGYTRAHARANIAIFSADINFADARASAAIVTTDSPRCSEIKTGF
jgi:hypothetical protein